MKDRILSACEIVERRNPGEFPKGEIKARVLEAAELFPNGKPAKLATVAAVWLDAERGFVNGGGW